MTTNHESLIALYLSGDKAAGQTLLTLCQQDKRVLAELATHTALNRLITLQQNKEDTDIFIAELKQLLTDKPDQTFSSIIQAKLIAQKKYNKTWLLPLFFLLALLLSVFIYINNHIDNEAPLAIIDKVAGAISSNKLLDENEEISKGGFELSDGYAQVKLSNGVTLVLEGPLKMSFNSANEIAISQGSLVAKVPKDNQQFTINTPTAVFKESGNEYAINVEKHGDSQLHVLQGNVKARSQHTKPYEEVSELQARNFSANQQIQTIQNNPEIFMRALPGKMTTSLEYLHWSFDQKNNNNFACDGPGINNTCYTAYGKTLATKNNDGVIGPKVVNGQFDNGIYFNGKDSWLETTFAGIPGNAPRTVAFWLKVPKAFSIDHGYGILSWGRPSDQAAWQISPNPAPLDGPLGRIRVGSSQAEVIGSTDIRDSRWHHVAVVLYGGPEVDLSTHVLMYLDGKLEQSSKKSIAKIFTQLDHPNSKPLTMGRNIGFTTSKLNSKKFFKGFIDELYIFNSALNQKQINLLMTQNSLE